MKFKICGKIAACLTLGVERFNGQLPIEVDTDGEVVVTRQDGRQMRAISRGGFNIPSSFLRDGRFTFTVNGIPSTAFQVRGNEAMRFTDSFSEEIANMWIAIAYIAEKASGAENYARRAMEDVEMFRDGYRTE